MSANHDTDDLRQESTGDLLRQLSDQTTTLVKQELDLAKAELAQKGKQVGAGAGMFGGAGLLGFFAFAAITTALIAVLTTAFSHLWLAAVVVGVVYAAIAGVLALTGKKQVQKAGPPVPEQAIESSKEDVQWAKTQAQSGRK